MDSKLLDIIRGYADGTLDRLQFAESFADMYFHVRRFGDKESRALCSAAIGPFAELSRGDRSEESLRGFLKDAIRPFANSEVQVEVHRMPPARSTHILSAEFGLTRKSIAVRKEELLVGEFAFNWPQFRTGSADRLEPSLSLQEA
jgi:hypothetical protein